DGVAYPASCYGAEFSFGSSMSVCAGGDDIFYNSFNGRVDEASMYGRVLSAEEIQSICNADWQGKFLDGGGGVNAAWQMHYFGHLGVDPSADADGDHLSNLQEYLLHSNPNQTAVADTNNAVRLQVFTPLARQP